MRLVLAAAAGMVALSVWMGATPSAASDATPEPLIALNGHFGNDIKVFLDAVDGSTALAPTPTGTPTGR